MSTVSLRSLLATSIAVALAVAGLSVLIGSGGSATASSSAPTGPCAAQAKDLTDSGLAAQASGEKLAKVKKRLRKAKQADRPAKVKKATKQMRRAKKELKLQVEWFTASKTEYDKCMKAHPTPTASP